MTIIEQVLSLRLTSLTRRLGTPLHWCAAAAVAGPIHTLSPQNTAKGTPSATAQRIRDLVDSLLPAELRANGIPGAAIAVVAGDSVVFSSGYGLASVEADLRVTDDMLFRVASTTKMLTAAGVLSAQSAGLLSLDAPISTWVPELSAPIGRLRLRDLLRHRSGLREGSSYYGPHHEEALGEFVRQWSDTMLFAPANDIYSYSNFGYALAGHVLARASGNSYSAAMVRFVFAPLGMTRSTLAPTHAMTFPLVQGHDLDSLGRTAVVRPYSDDTRFWPAGSVFTSANNFARFVMAVLNGGRLGGAQVIPADVVRALLERQSDVPDGPPSERAGYTLGLMERWRGPIRILQHGGSRIGFGSVVRLIPEKRIGIVILANRTGALPARTLEALTRMLVPEASSQAEPPAERELVRTSQSPGLVGRYVNTPQELELQLVDSSGGLAVRQTARSAAIPIHRLRDGRYMVGGQILSLVTGDRTREQYLVIAGHALRKVP